jgi:hypothetical protein
MAKISTNDEVAYPREKVFETFREDLEELIPHLPDIESIEQKKYERIDDVTVEVVRLWKAKDEDVPKLARKFIKPEMLQWTDTAIWHEDVWTCDWSMEVGFLSEAITAEGTNRYIDNGDSTKIEISGDLKVDAKHIPGVPRLLAGKVGDAVEKFVVKLITPNLTDVNRGLERYLEEQDD